MVPELVGNLYVNHLDTPFATMKVNKNLRQYDNKIIECNLVNGRWNFMRERTDKSFPNAFATAEGKFNNTFNSNNNLNFSKAS